MITFVNLKTEKMKDRISKILREEGMTATKFANEIGVQASSISHIISGRNKPSTDFLVKLLERFRGINAEWLITGKGNMYKESVSDTFSSIEENSPKSNDLFSSEPVNNDFEVENEPEFKSNSNQIKQISTESYGSGPNFNEKVEKNASELNKIPKKIEKVVVFFTDKTFESYNPK